MYVCTKDELFKQNLKPEETIKTLIENLGFTQIKDYEY